MLSSPRYSYSPQCKPVHLSIVLIILTALWACQDEQTTSSADLPELDMSIEEERSTDLLDMDSSSATTDVSTDMESSEITHSMSPSNLQDDESDLLFDANRLLQIEITLAEEKWDELRYQTRNLNLLKPDCLGQPFESPFTWFEATVVVDGNEFSNVGIRKKGFFGSLSEERPSLKVRLDKFIDGQVYQDVKRLTLNNSQQDPSLIKQCLAYDLFRQVGIVSPRCNFAHVYINNRDYGIFVQVESVKKPFLKRFFEEADGLLYEGTISDFRTDWLGTFRQKTNEDMPTDEPLRAIAQILENEQDPNYEQDLLSALSSVINLEQFFRFWAMETLIAHWDGYAGNTNNFLVYDNRRPGQMVFIPWGVDGTFNTPYQFFEERIAPRSINTAGMLTRLLYKHEQGQARYLETLNLFLDEVWVIENLNLAIDEKLALIVEDMEFSQQLAVLEEADLVREFISEQKELIRQEIDTGPIEWRTPPREIKAFCGEASGRVRGQFETTWNTWPSDDLFMTGSGNMQLTHFDESIAIQGVGCGIGIDEDDPTDVALLIPLYIGGSSLIFIRIILQPEEVTPQTLETNINSRKCSLFTYDFESFQFDEFASCVGGTLTLEEASREDGAPVRGTLEIDLWSRRPFSL